MSEPKSESDDSSPARAYGLTRLAASDAAIKRLMAPLGVNATATASALARLVSLNRLAEQASAQALIRMSQPSASVKQWLETMEVQSARLADFADLGESALAHAQASLSVTRHIHEAAEKAREAMLEQSLAMGRYAQSIAALERSARTLALDRERSEFATSIARAAAPASAFARLAEVQSALNGDALAKVAKQFEGISARTAALEARSLFPSLAGAAELASRLAARSLPVIDSASAAAIAAAWGAGGAERQLSALGVGPEVDSPNAAAPLAPDEGAGMGAESGRGWRAAAALRDAATLLGILLAIFQIWDSNRMEAELIGAIKDQGARHERQLAQLMPLLEAALRAQARLNEERFVVRERMAVARAAPSHGSSRVGSLFPNQIVKPMSERGKWIQIEWYDFLSQETRQGWALKKYFARARAPGPAAVEGGALDREGDHFKR